MPPSLHACAGLYEISLFFHKFISLKADDILERKGSSENRNAIRKTY